MNEIDKLKEELRILKNEYNSLKNAFYADVTNPEQMSDKRSYFNLLNSLTIELYNAKSIYELYEKLGKELNRLIPNSIVFLTSTNPEQTKSKIVSLEGVNSKLMTKIQTLLGFDVKKQEFDYVAEFSDRFFEVEQLTKFNGSFADFTTYHVSKAAAVIIEKLVGIKGIYYAGIKKDGMMLAGLLFFKLDDNKIDNLELIDSYIRNASIIIEKMAAERIASENCRILSNVVNSLPLAVFWKDTNGRYLGANKNFARGLGRTNISDIIGKTDDDPLIHNQNSENYKKEDFQVLSSGEPIFNVVHKLADENDEEMWVRVNKMPLKNSEGNIYGILGVFEEITERLLIENKLKENEERLRLALKVTNDIVWDWDVVKNTIEFNELGEKYIDTHNPEKFNGIPWWLKNIHPEDKERVNNYYIESLNNPKLDNLYYEYRYLKDNNLLYIVDRAIVIRDDEGLAYRLVGAMKDVTEERRIADELRDREQEFKLYLDNAFDGFFAMKNRKFTYANKRVLELIGLSYEQVVDEKFDLSSVIAKEFRPLIESKMQAREEGNHGLDQYEVEIITKNGEKKIIELSTASLGKVNEYYAIGVLRDVTFKKQSELKVKEESNLRKLVFDLALNFINAPLSILPDEIIHSLEMIGSYVGADRAYIFEYDFENNVCSGTYEWCAEGVSSHIDETQNVALDSITSLVEEHLQGKEFFVPNVEALKEIDFRKILHHQNIKSLISVPLMNDGEPIGFVGFDYTKREHTELNEQEYSLLVLFAKILVNIHLRINNELELILLKEKADESNRLKSSFLANMSHEIRTPINGIIGSINILKEPDLSEEEKDEYYNYLKTSGTRLINTIEDIVKISVIDSGQYELLFSNFNLLEVINDCIDSHYIFAKQKGLELRFISEDTEVELWSDRNNLSEIIALIVDNAIKFTDNGYIEITYKIDKSSSLISINVKDTGMGIPADKYYYIFNRFTQLHTDLSRPYEGSGLGLSIAKAYANTLGGDIKVESELGVGSTFCIILPYRTN